jgi:hypothetical protein
MPFCWEFVVDLEPHLTYPYFSDFSWENLLPYVVFWVEIIQGIYFSFIMEKSFHDFGIGSYLNPEWPVCAAPPF